MQAPIDEIPLLPERAAWVAPTCAGIAMVVSCLGLLWLDTLHKTPPPDPLSKLLEVKQQLAASELRFALDRLQSAQKSDLELKRQEADLWLEFAGVKMDPDGEKTIGTGVKIAVPPITEESLQSKLARMERARKKIDSLYSTTLARDEVLKLSRKMDNADYLVVPSGDAQPADKSKSLAIGAVFRTSASLGEATNATSVKSDETKEPPSVADHLFDERSALFYIYRALLIGLVLVFSYCGLYLLHRLAKLAGLNFDMVKSIDAVMERASGSGRSTLSALPTILLGSAAFAGGALAVGNAIGGGSSTPSAAGSTHNSSSTRWGDFYRSEHNNLGPVITPPGSSPLAVDLGGQKLAVDLQGQKLAVHVPDPGEKWTGMFDGYFGEKSPIVNRLESSSTNFLNAATAFQNIKTTPTVNYAAAFTELEKKLRELTERQLDLTKSVVYVDCNLQRAVVAVFNSSLHNGYADNVASNIPKPCDPQFSLKQEKPQTAKR